MGALVVDRELTAEDAVRAALPLDVLEAAQAMARGAQLRVRTDGEQGARWQLEQLHMHADARLRWAALDPRTAAVLVARRLVFRTGAPGVWTYYALAEA